MIPWRASQRAVTFQLRRITRVYVLRRGFRFLQWTKSAAFCVSDLPAVIWASWCLCRMKGLQFSVLSWDDWRAVAYVWYKQSLRRIQLPSCQAGHGLHVFM